MTQLILKKCKWKALEKGFFLNGRFGQHVPSAFLLQTLFFLPKMQSMPMGDVYCETRSSNTHYDGEARTQKDPKY